MKLATIEIKLSKKQQFQIGRAWGKHGSNGATMIAQPRLAGGNFGLLRLAIFSPESAERISAVIEEQTP